MPKTELHPAWWCYCEACGMENYLRPMVEELTEEDAAEVEEAGFAHEDLHKMMLPETIVCGHCGVEQEVDHGGE